MQNFKEKFQDYTMPVINFGHAVLVIFSDHTLQAFPAVI